MTAILSACGYAAAFGAIQMTPLQIVAGLPDMAQKTKAAEDKVKAAKEGTPEFADAKAQQAEARQFLKARRAARSFSHHLHEVSDAGEAAEPTHPADDDAPASQEIAANDARSDSA